MSILTEKEAENFLEKSGFDVISRAVAKSEDGLLKISGLIKFPWAMKASSKKLVHKANLGGVILNIKSVKEAKKAFSRLSKIKGFEEVMIQPMMKGEKLILGLKKTPEFGMVIMVGKGGSRVEEERDVSFRVLPITEKDAEAMLKDLKSYTLLKNKGANFKIIEKNLMKLSTLARKYPGILELDINPLGVTGNEAKIVDARIVLE